MLSSRSQWPEWNIVRGPNEEEVFAVLPHPKTGRRPHRKLPFVTEDGKTHDIEIIFCVGGTSAGLLELEIMEREAGMDYNPRTGLGRFFSDY